MSAIKKTFTYGRQQVTLETGEIARQAGGAVLVSIEDTVVLVTVVAKTDVKPGQDFFPLTVDYQEKTYAAGRIPGGFLKRESRASDGEILICRLIDRPIRPLFPDGFFNEVQIIATVMSSNPEVSADIPALIGASAALSLSGLPFDGPVGAARVGFINGEYVLNPTHSELKNSALDLVVAGTESAVLMVESEAMELPEDIMLGAVVFGHTQMRAVINAINELADEAGADAWDWQAPAEDVAMVERLKTLAEDGLQQAYNIKQKQARMTAVDDVRSKAFAELITADMDTVAAQPRQGLPSTAWKPAWCVTASCPASHVSTAATPAPCARSPSAPAYCRAPTAPLCSPVAKPRRWSSPRSAPDATNKPSMRSKAPTHDRFMMQYNMPPYATGETGRVGAPKRREVGHGRLAKRALMAVLPTKEEFGYTMRVVSEITESNGSSSMASVCGGCLSLMDAGAPLKAHVAGIAMGLIKEGGKFAVLTDILGDEDHLGDMDFKVAGTEKGVTALQMDIKIQGITAEIMDAALKQAKEGRLHILEIMKTSVSSGTHEMSAYAPRIIAMKINPEKIRDVIGKGGAVIRALTEETGTQIDIQEDGSVKIACTSIEAGELAKRRIEEITAEVEVGKVYEGPVIKLLDFGAIVNVLPGRDGLLHISQIAHERVNTIGDYLKEGQVVKVKILEADEKGRLRLSMKALLEAPAPAPAAADSETPENAG